MVDNSRKVVTKTLAFFPPLIHVKANESREKSRLRAALRPQLRASAMSGGSKRKSAHGGDRSLEKENEKGGEKIAMGRG